MKVNDGGEQPHESVEERIERRGKAFTTVDVDKGADWGRGGGAQSSEPLEIIAESKKKTRIESVRNTGGG